MTHSLGPPLSDEEIAGLEKELGVILPPDYRAFLRKHNGGVPQQNLFPIRGFSLSAEGVLARFLGVADSDYDDLVNFKRDSEGRVPPELLPIGHDIFGNSLCLGVTGPNRGKVYWWFHEEEVEEGEPPTYENIYPVTNSFADLLDSLTEIPEDD